MAKKGRPFTYKTPMERPVVVSVRISRSLRARLELYARDTHQSLSEVTRMCLEWRLQKEEGNA